MRKIPESDFELIQEVAAGSEEAFCELYLRLQGRVYRFALYMSGSRTLAEDLVQDTFLILFDKSGHYDPGKGSVANFVLGITCNCLRRLPRHDRRFFQMPRNDREIDQWMEPAVNPGPYDVLSRSETVLQVRNAVLALPLRYREVVVLCELEDRTYEDAAELLGCSCGTVRSRLHRARALLAEKLRALNLGPELSKSKSRRCLA